MTSRWQRHHTPRMLVNLALATVVGATLLAAGCGGSGSTAGAAGSSVTARETAETRLLAIGARLSTVLADYRAGKSQQAYALATSVSTHLYEGTTEGIVASCLAAIHHHE